MTTIAKFFWNRVDRTGEQTALRRWHGEQWQPVTWREFSEDVLRGAAVLQDAHIQPGDTVASYAANSYQWLVLDLAIQALRAVHLPIHAPLTGSQAAFQLNHAQAKLVVAGDGKAVGQLARAASAIDGELPCFALQATTQHYRGRPPRNWQQSLPAVDWLGRRDEIRALADGPAEEPATILYTSGTTGEPKGVVLSHANLLNNAQSVFAAMDDRRAGLRLNILPLSHIYARLCDLYVWLVAPVEIAVARSRETIFEDCQTLSPHWINGVPYFFEKCWKILRAHGAASQPGSLQQLLGGNVQYCCCGGGALPEWLFDFFHEQGVPLLPGYGLTETSPVVSMSTRESVRRGAVGRVLDDMDIRMAADGEILTRGPAVMVGYHRDEQATANVFSEDGWFKTGDLGHLDDEGFLHVTGRKKEILVTAGGKNVAPVKLEALLTAHPLILQACVVGEGRNFLGALIVLDLEEVRRRQHALGRRLTGDPAVCPEVRSWIAEAIRRKLSQVSHYEQVRTFEILARPFTVESGELTPKLSLRRFVILATFADNIAAMYAALSQGHRPPGGEDDAYRESSAI